MLQIMNYQKNKHIDTPSVRDYAVQVLEGGREAFLMREKKYGIGEYNHFMNK